MKKKLKALLEGNTPIDNVEVARLKKALEAAKLKFKKAKTARSEAKSAFKKAAEQWLSNAEVPHAQAPKSAKKPAKVKKTKATHSKENTKSPASARSAKAA